MSPKKKDSDENNKDKKTKTRVPKALKIAVWDKHFTEDVGKAKCMCCEITDITQAKFHCGHIIAEANGGETNISNLVPICESCNKSMGTKHLEEFKKIICNNKKQSGELKAEKQEYLFNTKCKKCGFNVVHGSNDPTQCFSCREKK